MYHPYFRGKQYELVTIREAAPLMASSSFVPIVEPVKESFRGLKRALDAVVQADGEAVVILNPSYGDQVENTPQIESWVRDNYGGAKRIGVGVVAGQGQSPKSVAEVCGRYRDDREVTIVHDGFTDGPSLAGALADQLRSIRHVFTAASAGKLYQRTFRDGRRVLLRDGFRRRINREYPKTEPFSELHVTYQEEGMRGFGDYLIVGDEYLESGGPAYAVAIHLTYIDHQQADQMFIHHFVSNKVDTPKDPAGKFKEALDKLARECERPETQVLKTAAVVEFLDLHKQKHFPGLGYIKKLSMLHHVQTLADFFKNGGG